jgi:hypothetical protein
MTAKLGSAITNKVMQRISGPAGLKAALGTLAMPGSAAAAVLGTAQVRAQNVAADLAERSGSAQYPAINVYCEKISNTLTEKFRRFSGSVQMAMELRHSQDRLEGLEDALEMYADAATGFLHEARGDWGEGMFFDGRYQVSFGAVKHGGKNFIQTAKVTFEIGVSKS